MMRMNINKVVKDNESKKSIVESEGKSKKMTKKFKGEIMY